MAALALFCAILASTMPRRGHGITHRRCVSSDSNPIVPCFVRSTTEKVSSTEIAGVDPLHKSISKGIPHHLACGRGREPQRFSLAVTLSPIRFVTQVLSRLRRSAPRARMGCLSPSAASVVQPSVSLRAFSLRLKRGRSPPLVLATRRLRRNCSRKPDSPMIVKCSLTIRNAQCAPRPGSQPRGSISDALSKRERRFHGYFVKHRNSSVRL